MYCHKAILLFALLLTTAGIPAQSTLDSLLNQHYDGGAVAFRETIYQNLKYPRQERQRCIMAHTSTSITVDSAGNITSVDFDNRSVPGLERQIRKAITKTADGFAVGQPVKIPMTFSFAINDEKIDADIRVIAYSTGNLGCLTAEDLLQEVITHIENEKYKKAKKALDQLLMRYPYSHHYLALSKMVDGRLSQ